jgi:hypothetical protein
MNDKLIKLLGLDPKSTEDQILAAVKALVKTADAAQAADKTAAELNRLVGASAGALDHARAATVLQHREAFAASDIGKQFAKQNKPAKK